MKSYLLFAFSLVLLIIFSCDKPKKEIESKPKYDRFQRALRRESHANDSLLVYLDSKGYLEYYQKAVFYFKYKYFQCHCYGYDDKVHPMDGAKFMLNSVEEKYDTIWNRPDTIINLFFSILVRDSIQCHYGAKLKSKKSAALKHSDTHYTLIYGLTFSKKDTTLLKIWDYNCGSISTVPSFNMKYYLPIANKRLENFKFNRQYADDTLNYLFEKYKNDSIIYY